MYQCVSVAALLMVLFACGPSVDARWEGLQPKSSKAVLAEGGPDKLLINWDANYDNRGKATKEMHGLFAAAGWSERRPAHRQAAHSPAFISRWLKDGQYVDLSMVRDDSKSLTQVAVKAIGTPPVSPLPAAAPWEAATALRPKVSFATPLECALPQPAIYSADGTAVRKEPRAPGVDWKPEWKLDGKKLYRPGNVEQCVNPKVWRSDTAAAFLCKRKAQACSHPLEDNRAWLLVVDGGAGAEAVNLVGRAATHVFGEPKDHRIVDGGEVEDRPRGIEVRFQPGVDMYELDGDTTQRDHFRETALEVLSTIERDLQVGSITLKESYDGPAPIVVVVGGSVAAR